MQLFRWYAPDVPLHPEDRELSQDKLDAKRFSWLRRHDQETSHPTSIYFLAVGMPIRLTDNVDRSSQLYRSREGKGVCGLASLRLATASTTRATRLFTQSQCRSNPCRHSYFHKYM